MPKALSLVIAAILFSSGVSPACPPNHPPRIVRQISPRYPTDVECMLLGPIEIEILVSVASDGTMNGYSYVLVSSNAELNRDALRVAEQSTYQPALANCWRVAGTVLVTVTYTVEGLCR